MFLSQRCGYSTWVLKFFFQEEQAEVAKIWQKLKKKSPNFIRTKDRHRITYVLVS